MAEPDNKDEPGSETKLDKPDRVSSRNVHDPDFGPRYRVLGPLGRGGMGEVFRAYDVELKGEVALKVVRGDRTDQEASLVRFRREIALARKVTSPNVLRVYDLAEHDGLRFLSMEYVDGEDLGALMRRGRIPIERALSIFRQVCNGLASAHEQGVVHRDLKPQNVLIDKEHRVHIADFGLARSIGDSGMTASGAVLGSPAYMSPEQVKGDPADERSDIYSLGIMAYQLIAGETPFRADTPHAVMEMRLHKTPRPLDEVAPGTPPSIVQIVARCLALEPSERYQSVHDVLDELGGNEPPKRDSAPSLTRFPTPLPQTPVPSASITHVTAPRRPLWPFAVAGLAVAASVIAVFVVLNHSHHEAPIAAPATQPAGSGAAVAAPVGVVVDNQVRVLVTKVDNRTGDPMFEGTIDVMFESALRRSRVLEPIATNNLVALANELVPGKPLDLELARKVAARDHCRVVLVTASVVTKQAGFVITVQVTESTGTQLADQTLEAANADLVIPAVGKWGFALRRTLGEVIAPGMTDDVDTAMSSHLDAVHEFAVGRGLLRNGDSDAALAHIKRSLAVDPDFPLAHMALGTVNFNTGRLVDANEANQATLKYVARLGERDRLKFLGDYHNYTSGEYERAIASYEELLRQWPHDENVSVNLGTTYQSARDLHKAVEVGRRSVDQHPYNVIGRSNLVGYLISDDQLVAARHEVDDVIKSFPKPLAVTYVYRGVIEALAGDRNAALATFELCAGAGEPEIGFAAKADLLLSESRLREAEAVLTKALAADVAADNQDAAELAMMALAETRLRRGDKKAAVAAANKVHKEFARTVLASVVALAGGDDKLATETVERFAKEVAPRTRAMGRLVEAEALRVHKKPAAAVGVIQEAIKIADSWFAHFLLGHALFDAGRFADAEKELSFCVAHPGEGSMMFLDDSPTMRYLSASKYWLARTNDELHKPDANDYYKGFLANQATADHDPLVDDALRRVKR